MAVHYALRYESSFGEWTEDSEQGPRRSVAIAELDNLARLLEAKEWSPSDWAMITLIIEPTKNLHR